MHLILTLASKNEGKLRELRHWLNQSGLPIALALNDAVGDIPETGRDFLANARIKALATPPVSSGGWVLAEDSGMIVDALDGCYGIRPFPGLFSNRWMTPDIRHQLLGQSFPNRMPLERLTEEGVSNHDLCQGILSLMQNQENRTARYVCGMVLWNPDKGILHEATGSTELRVIDDEPRGLNGFGYDPITTLPGESRTMAELSVEEKNGVSHRGQAFRKILTALETCVPD